jgi:hypothetical protein
MKGIRHKNPMQTRHGRTRYKAFSHIELMLMYNKESSPKKKHKIIEEINRKLKNLGIVFRVSKSNPQVEI